LNSAEQAPLALRRALGLRSNAYDGSGRKQGTPLK
jgi:hypothetical protein